MDQPISRRTALPTMAAMREERLWQRFPSLCAGRQTQSELGEINTQGLQWLSVARSLRWATGAPTCTRPRWPRLAGTALICSGSTTTQGPYARNIRRTVDYLISKAVQTD